MTVYDRFSSLTGVLVIVHACAFMVFSWLRAFACYVLGFCMSFCICILTQILGWLYAPGRGYMTVCDKFSLFTGVLVLHACAFMVFS